MHGSTGVSHSGLCSYEAGTLVDGAWGRYDVVDEGNNRQTFQFELTIETIDRSLRLTDLAKKWADAKVTNGVIVDIVLRRPMVPMGKASMTWARTM